MRSRVSFEIFSLSLKALCPPPFQVLSTIVHRNFRKIFVTFKHSHVTFTQLKIDYYDKGEKVSLTFTSHFSERKIWKVDISYQPQIRLLIKIRLPSFYSFITTRPTYILRTQTTSHNIFNYSDKTPSLGFTFFNFFQHEWKPLLYFCKNRLHHFERSRTIHNFSTLI